MKDVSYIEVTIPSRVLYDFIYHIELPSWDLQSQWLGVIIIPPLLVGISHIHLDVLLTSVLARGFIMINRLVKFFFDLKIHIYHVILK